MNFCSVLLASQGFLGIRYSVQKWKIDKVGCDIVCIIDKELRALVMRFISDEVAKHKFDTFIDQVFTAMYGKYTLYLIE